MSPENKELLKTLEDVAESLNQLISKSGVGPHPHGCTCEYHTKLLILRSSALRVPELDEQVQFLKQRDKNWRTHAEEVENELELAETSLVTLRAELKKSKERERELHKQVLGLKE